jgi:hypothetical protein
MLQSDDTHESDDGEDGDEEDEFDDKEAETDESGGGSGRLVKLEMGWRCVPPNHRRNVLGLPRCRC